MRWAHELAGIDIRVAGPLHLPGLLYRRRTTLSDGVSVPVTGRRPGLLSIDERGKWDGLRHNRHLSRAGRFIERTDDAHEPLILSVDVTGIGELAADPVAYDMASWNDVERVLTYISISSGRPIMGLRTRDVLYALDVLLNRDEVDETRIHLRGRGVGALCVLFAVSLTAMEFTSVTLWEVPASYQSMTEVFPFAWPQSVVVQDVLKHFDLPDLVRAIRAPDIHILNPLDAQRNPIDRSAAADIYREADGRVHIHCGVSESAATDLLVKSIYPEETEEQP